ncbi:hypothetical protein ASC61_12555 [Aeromicrobium sp. Root344]|nr:hypothetical protein ASC61_12555 [Aeromicrobium sp. Root344]
MEPNGELYISGIESGEVVRNELDHAALLSERRDGNPDGAQMRLIDLVDPGGRTGRVFNLCASRRCSPRRCEVARFEPGRVWSYSDHRVRESNQIWIRAD